MLQKQRHDLQMMSNSFLKKQSAWRPPRPKLQKIQVNLREP